MAAGDIENIFPPCSSFHDILGNIFECRIHGDFETQTNIYMDVIFLWLYSDKSRIPIYPD